MPEIDFAYEAERSLRRIRPKILDRIERSESSRFSFEERVEVIDARLAEHWERLFMLLHQLYGNHYDFFFYLENILLTAIDCWLNRPDDLYDLDIRRENDPGWYLSNNMAGGSLYVDLFSGDLPRLREKIPYFQELGLSYVHLMPLYASRAGNSDGGYAISDYRAVDPKLGTLEDLQLLAADFRAAGISLVLDFVFNHTSDDHEWAIQAREGDREHLDYYHTYPDRTIPDQYEQHLREIFPTVRRGNFTWHEELQRWVWTTFNSFQWDLKYANPEVFRAMSAEMLFLANTGVEILRLDAVAFIWKQMGTNCENLPQAHTLIQAFNSVCRIAAPGLAFKSEAIVHPDEVAKYIHRQECQISYNPTLMALLWESIATRQTKLLKQSLSHRHQLPRGTSWVNYLRGHDDIGWSFDNGDAWAVGINPDGHRKFLNDFYTGAFEGSFARGVPFQHNTDTGDMRVSGTMASLAGLEEAAEQDDKELREMALRRIRMLQGVLASIGGIPLIFLGEEWGLLNDYDYLEDPEKAEDSRWVHRPAMDWNIPKKHRGKKSTPGRLFRSLKEILEMRKALPALVGNQFQLLPVDDEHVLAYLRWHDASNLIVIANFSEKPRSVDLSFLRQEGIAHFLKDVFSQQTVSTKNECSLGPYELLWLEED
ncbi:amylosucrase [Coraliomargarita sinensis]|uniref:Amylosucrase n=1 Tax=Coraliomargarita sinensis TaxID=2174842 RepID=A0A317ZJ10_9BACT|nr:alpha-amylase family glycosyl hydrolase [Coraliomargarita sinensis]PXA05530.1 amylosucrase [Coraliomargarita sinensis]